MDELNTINFRDHRLRKKVNEIKYEGEKLVEGFQRLAEWLPRERPDVATKAQVLEFGATMMRYVSLPILFPKLWRFYTRASNCQQECESGNVLVVKVSQEVEDDGWYFDMECSECKERTSAFIRSKELSVIVQAHS